MVSACPLRSQLCLSHLAESVEHDGRQLRQGLLVLVRGSERDQHFAELLSAFRIAVLSLLCVQRG